MPKKLRKPEATPSLVHERLVMWGRCIRTQRVGQRILASDLCARIGIAEATLRRLERGDPGASAAVYLSALMVLGVLDFAAPALDAQLWSADPHSRVRNTSEGTADEDF
jgi:hypothetical protein